MAEPRLHSVQCPVGDAVGAQAGSGHRMAFWEWGAPDAAHTVVCAHGLTRQGRDFDVLAQALVARAPHPLRVLCPDVAGRGRSDWLADPQYYQVPIYTADMLALLAQLQLTQVDWVGTSMGGLIGMGVCTTAVSVGAQVRRLLINDVGPTIEIAALRRIGAYLGQPLRFDTPEQAAAALWAVSSSFGPHTPQQWLDLCRPMLKAAADGAGWVLHYDPAIALPFRMVTDELAEKGQAMAWAVYDQIQAPTLLLRGSQSDLLSAATAAEMGQRGPRARLYTVDGVGHAPTLIAQDQIDVVADFLFA